MKLLSKLSAIAVVVLAISSLTARAQTTNIIVTVRVIDGSGTNSYTLNASAQHVLGAIVSYNTWQAAAAGNTNSFPVYVRQNIVDKIAPLADIGNQYTSQTNRLYSISQQLPTLFLNMSAADQAAFVALFRKYSP